MGFRFFKYSLKQGSWYRLFLCDTKNAFRIVARKQSCFLKNLFGLFTTDTRPNLDIIFTIQKGDLRFRIYALQKNSFSQVYFSNLLSLRAVSIPYSYKICNRKNLASM
jgi:hypothetical protein